MDPPVGKRKHGHAKITDASLRDTQRSEQVHKFMAGRHRRGDHEQKQKRKVRGQVLIANEHANGEADEECAHPESGCEHDET